jgi:transposase
VKRLKVAYGWSDENRNHRKCRVFGKKYEKRSHGLSNLIPLFQPAHSPEVNPIERLWQALKGRWKGENFPSLEALRQRFSDELQQMTPEAIQSLTGDDFILETLLAANFQHFLAT